jgi:hypothetical protein
LSGLVCEQGGPAMQRRPCGAAKIHSEGVG